jgi:ribosomal protein S18 acetylase RimI-like enzyme
MERIDNLLKYDKHGAFKRILDAGYALHRELHQQSLLALSVQVRKDNDVVGTAEFSVDDDGGYCQNVDVDDGHRRRGIANAMYAFAELSLGVRLYDFWGTDTKQTPSAKALWSQAKRPFG